MHGSRLVAMVGVLVSAAVLGQVRPVLTVSFDDDFSGVGRTGAIAARLEGKPERAPGRVGQALKSGPGLGYVEFPTTDLLNRTGGTVEMWVCPLDWEPDDRKFHVFFEMRGDGAFYLYKYWTEPKLLMLTCPHLDGPYTSSSAAVADWQPGQWHHLAGTWSRQGVQVYVDGKPAGNLPVGGALPTAMGQTFRLGDQPWQFPRTTASLVDEVRIYDRALTPPHIAAHCAGDFGFTVALTAEAARLDFSIDPVASEAEVQVDTAGADVDDRELRAELGIVTRGQRLPEPRTSHPFTGGQASAVLPLPARTPGDYEVVAQLYRQDRPIFELRRALTVPVTDWLGNTLGLEDKVLPPWTPLRVQGSAVECWARVYGLGEALLPTRIQSAGAELLARPMALRGEAEGTPVDWQQTGRCESASDTRVVLTGTARATVGGRSLGFRSKLTVEYDGLLLVEVCTDGPPAPAPETLAIDIPLRTPHALYRHRWAASWVPTSGLTPAGEGTVEASSFVPFWWFGDNDRGLFWFCESDEMWPNARAQNAIETVRTGDAVSLRLNLLAKGQSLPADWRFAFGLQATPVKPLAPDWRKWRLSPGRNANVEIVWPHAGKPDSLRYFGYPQAADPERFAAYIDGLHTRGLKAVPYLCLTYITEAIPEWRFFRRIWEMGSVDPSIPEAGWDHTFAMVSPVGKGYSDFIIPETRRFLERYRIDGVYHDQTHPYSSSNVLAGVGYVRDGQAHQTYPILGFRALYRRNYAMVKSLPRETFTMAHMSGKVVAPVLAYDDAYLDGEHFRGVVKDDYLQVTTLEAFRAEYMGRQWGLMPVFLPEFDAAHAARIEPTRGLMALLLLHDVGIWPIWCNLNVVNEALAAMDAFGYVTAEFIPYFDPVPPASTDLEGVYVSGYRRPDGQVLLVVANLGHEARRGDLLLDLARLGVTPQARVSTWPEPQPLTLTERRLPVELPGLAYRLLVVQSR